jgi:hypothetical protein
MKNVNNKISLFYFLKKQVVSVFTKINAYCQIWIYKMYKQDIYLRKIFSNGGRNTEQPYPPKSSLKGGLEYKLFLANTILKSLAHSSIGYISYFA